MLSLRCSSAPLAMKCPASTVPPVDEILSGGEAADMGTAVHAVLANWIGNGRAGIEYIGEAAAEFNIEDTDELSRLSWNGWRCWEQIQHEYPDPKIEYAPAAIEADGLRLTTEGVDLHAGVGEQIRVLDWKTGRLDLDAQDQLKAYCLLLSREYPFASTFHASKVNVRAMSRDCWLWSRDDLAAWWQRLADVAARQFVFKAGRHCGFCHRSHECHVFEGYMQQSVNVVSSMQVLPAEPLARANMLVELLDRAKLLEHQIDMAKDLVKAEVARCGGAMDCGDGTELAIATTARRKMKWSKEAEAIALGNLDADVVRECLTPSITQLHKAAMAAAPRGQKGKLANEFIQSFDDAGCVTVAHSESLEHRQVQKAIEVEA